MKKGLSILLVAAALFGFYGGAVNLNDVLACKDYWEEKGAETTANMNKLEDGLNQLKENEKAYLDGLDQVAEGEQTLADGEAQYAQGLEDYEAAPGKLADARKQIAQGEKDLAAGEKKLSDGYAARAAGAKKLADGETAKAGLDQLVNGLNKIINGYTNWQQGFEQLQAGRKQFSTVLGSMKGTASDPYQLKKFANTGTTDYTGAYTGALDNIINDSYGQNGKGYEDYIKNIDTVVNLSPVLEQVRQATAEKLGTLNNALTQLKTQADSGKAQSDLNEDGVVDEKDDEIVQDNAKKQYCGTVKTYSDNLKSAAEGNENETLLNAAINAVAAGNYNAQYSTYINALASGAYDKTVGAKSSIETLKSTFESTKGSLEAGIESLNEGQQNLADGTRTIATAILGNSTLKAAVQEKMGSNGIALLTALKTNPGLMDTATGTLEDFSNKMEKSPYNLLANLKTAKGYLAAASAEAQKALDKGYADLAAADKKLAKGEKDLAAGKKKLADGKAQYAQGLEDYAAAPGKLADAEQQLADGRQALADGKAQLAQYEDGEQQVRDGLATLAGTEADPGLDSILDRLNGDDDFDNGDGHLELDEGLNAVEVGRGYQADDGVLITEEIMARAVGTGALLAAGALAVIAAILSFLKKNKGAGVLAILAAAAGAFGAYYGTQAGTYFSSIAGSAVGATGWVAAGILGAVALVHAIAHFTAKTEA